MAERGKAGRDPHAKAKAVPAASGADSLAHLTGHLHRALGVVPQLSVR
jgi:hypothetical protein